ATAQLHTSGGGIFLLGIEPRESDPELGYIVPSRRDALVSSFAVERFVEKPPLTKASKLIEHGALWNAFIIVATAQALLVLFEERFPNIVAQMRCALQSDTNDPGEGAAMKRLYEQLPTI